MTLYIAVTLDKYELPLAVADSPKELAKLCGTTPGAIRSAISNAKAGKCRSRYKKINIEEDDNGKETFNTKRNHSTV